MGQFKYGGLMLKQLEYSIWILTPQIQHDCNRTNIDAIG